MSAFANCFLVFLILRAHMSCAVPTDQEFGQLWIKVIDLEAKFDKMLDNNPCLNPGGKSKGSCNFLPAEANAIQQQEARPDVEDEDRLERLQNQLDRYETEHRQLTNTVTALNVTIANVDEYLKETVLQFNDFRDDFPAAIEDEVNRIEKCQSGTNLGVHEYPECPIFPTNVTVYFKPAFRNPPSVVFGLMMVDASSTAKLRLNSAIDTLTNEFFTLRIWKWAYSALYGAKFSWMACPT